MLALIWFRVMPLSTETIVVVGRTIVMELIADVAVESLMTGVT